MSRILVIDDEKNVRRNVELTLRRAGYEVTATPDGPAGLEMFEDGSQWDLTIVDERMPGMSGRDVIREMLRRNPDARAIMVTAFASSSLAAEAVERGAVDFLRKPFSTEMLRRAVAASLSRAPHAGESDAADHAEEPKTLTHFLNGFYYRAVPTPPSDSASRLPMEFAFEVRAPLSEPAVCLVGLTPHVIDLVKQDTDVRGVPGKRTWEMICQSALADYLWEHGDVPPARLPVFELTIEQMEAIRRLTGSAPAVSY